MLFIWASPHLFVVPSFGVPLHRRRNLSRYYRNCERRRRVTARGRNTDNRLGRERAPLQGSACPEKRLDRVASRAANVCCMGIFVRRRVCKLFGRWVIWLQAYTRR